jgi:integrase
VPLARLPKYVKAQPNPSGGVRYYFRYRGVYQRLPGDPESAEFYARYSALLAGASILVRRPAEGSIAAVIAHYKGTEEFQQLAPKTQRDYARHLDRFADHGHWPVEEFKRRHIKEMQKRLNKTPRTAKYFAQVSSVLFAHAIDEMGLIEVNPAAKLKRLDKAEAYKAWSDEECGKFEASNPPRALLSAYMLGRYTGQRGGDILRWTRAVYDGHTFRFRQSKTARLERPEMVIPALPPLRSYLDALPRDNTVLLVATPEGSAYGETRFRHEFRAALNSCGLKHLSFHGLRHAAGVTLAEAGASEKEIMAWLGHATPGMAAHYCKMAELKKLTASAGSKWTACKLGASQTDESA